MLPRFLRRRLVALSLLRRMRRPGDEDSIGYARGVLATFPKDISLLLLATDQLTAADERPPLDEPRDSNGPAALAAAALRSRLLSLTPAELEDPRTGGRMNYDLGCALRLLGRTEDQAAQAAFRSALATAPRNGQWWYGFGLCHKYRGRWEEGARANQRAIELGVRNRDSAFWNLGICATGASDTAAALRAWRQLGMGEQLDAKGCYRQAGRVQVRLCTLGTPAGPEVRDDRALEFEHVWVDRLGPVHGRIISATLWDCPADYGDVVLFDAAPCGWRDVDGKRVPRFPMLAVLEPGHQHLFRFAARQPQNGAVASMEDELPKGSRLYVLSENVSMICASCARGVTPHAHAPQPAKEHPVVYGKLFAPPDADIGHFRAQLRRALLRRPQIRLAAPDLDAAVGDDASARAGRALWDELERS
jgi:hypothetical protein